jgi:hypothetical protein
MPREPRQVAHAVVADELDAGHARAQLASLRQRKTRDIARTAPNAVKCARQKI